MITVIIINSNNWNHYNQKTIDTHTAEQNTTQNVVNTPHVTCIGTCYIPNSQRVSSENNNWLFFWRIFFNDKKRSEEETRLWYL